MTEKHTRPPNVVVFISDQQRADTMPGVTPVAAHTPHLAWLTEQGVSFRNAICASPLCTPARGALLTGLCPQATGVVANYNPDPLTLSVPDDVKLLADYLQHQGYACGYTGKWHLPTGDDRRGFRDFVKRLTQWDVDSAASDDAAAFARKLGVDIGDTYAQYLRDERGETPTGGGATKLPLAFHPSTLQAQQAAHFVRSMKDRDQPFLLTYSCTEPHPLGMRFNISPCPFDRMYDPAAMPLPETRRSADAARVVRKRNYGGLIPTDDYSDDQLREMIAGYYGAVSYVDHLTGLILEALIETDQLDNTLFIFTSDHGEMLAHHRMLKKGPVMYDDMIKVPLVIKFPGGLNAGRVVEGLVSHLDLVPTILARCGAETDVEFHGRNLSALAEGKVQSLRDGIASEYHSCRWGQPPIPLRAWRTLEWKYVETVGGDDELYDLAHNPGETRNLIDDPSRQQVRRRMQAQLHEWLASVGDPWPEIPIAEEALPMVEGVWDQLAR